MPTSSIRGTRKSSTFSNTERVEVADIDTLLAGKRCLVLDDEFLIALDIQQILEAAGAASVTCVGNAEDALAAVRAGPVFDLAVLDVKLSGDTPTSMNVAAALSEQGTRFVFLTGMRSDDMHTAQYPDVAVVEKPYEAPLLLQALRRALAAR
jgi:CheY-like chemotaxis protein